MGKNITSAVLYGDFGQVNSFTNTIGNKTDTISYTYDDFYRIKSRNLNGMEKSTEYTYLKGQNGQDTTLVESFNNSKETYSYTYDVYGNILTVSKGGVLLERYTYDSLHRLTKVTKGSDVYTYTYDAGGNITSVKKNGVSVKEYSYGDNSWSDRLTSFNGTNINYDEIGNPLNWRNNMTLSWEYGRRLKTVTADGNDISYTYDADGLRTSKTVNGVKTEYYWLDGVLQGQKTGSEYIIFLYDENGTAYGMLINQNGVESYYYYLFNLQGDIVGIMDSNGATVTEYTYDAWGTLLTTTGTLASTIGEKNPLRYRGYYYDSETGFYYLKSRYYDPYVQRFINADGQLSMGSDLTGMNLFAYCGNNPVNRIDSEGYMWKSVKKWISNTWNNVKKTANQFINTVKKKAYTAYNKVIKKHYEERTEKNGTHPTYEDVVSNSNWTKVSEDQTKYHDNGIGKAELKFTNEDGREAVFDGDTLEPMTDPRYIATYNFCPIQQLPNNPGISDYVIYGKTTIGHAWKDVLPYYIWGNSPDDTTTIIDRILLSF